MGLHILHHITADRADKEILVLPLPSVQIAKRLFVEAGVNGFGPPRVLENINGFFIIVFFRLGQEFRLELMVQITQTILMLSYLAVILNILHNQTTLKHLIRILKR